MKHQILTHQHLSLVPLAKMLERPLIQTFPSHEIELGYCCKLQMHTAYHALITAWHGHHHWHGTRLFSEPLRPHLLQAPGASHVCLCTWPGVWHRKPQDKFPQPWPRRDLWIMLTYVHVYTQESLRLKDRKNTKSPRPDDSFCKHNLSLLCSPCWHVSITAHCPILLKNI